MKSGRPRDEVAAVRKPLELEVMGCRFSVDCRDAASRELIAACYAAFLAEDAGGATPTRYRVDEKDGAWVLACEQHTVRCPTLADLLYDFEKDMTIRVQLQRPDLLFVHAAAVAKDDRCVIIAGESGAGKSTLCWTLCNAGFAYMSDELAAVDPVTGFVAPYPHALCLKERPSVAPRLPAATVDVATTLHIPVAEIPGPHATLPTKLAAILFIDKSAVGSEASGPARIGVAEAAARLYANALNQSAHQGEGLAAVTRIASAAPSYVLRRSDPAVMGKSVRQVLRSSLLAA